MRCLQAFTDIAGKEGLLLICGDKSYRNEAEVKSGVGVHLTAHGSFSVMVNADALGKQVERLGGFSMHTPHGDTTFNNSVFVVPPNGRRRKMLITRRAFERTFCDFSPTDYIHVFEHLDRNLKKPSLETILAHLRLSHWDTEVFKLLFSHLESLAPQADEEMKDDLRQALETVWEHYFPVQEGDDIAFSLGSLLYAIDDYETAYERFAWSLANLGKHPATYTNLGLCAARLGRKAQAVRHLKAALALDPKFKLAKKEFKRLQEGAA